MMNAVADVIRSCRVHGMGKNKYENVRIGMTGRLDSMQAVVLNAKLDIFEQELTLRQTVADRYQKLIGDIVDTPRLVDGGQNQAGRNIALNCKNQQQRSSNQTSWCQRGSNRDLLSIPMHQQPPYKDFPQSQCGLGVTL